MQSKSIAGIAEAYTKFAEAVMAAEAANRAAFSLKVDEINDFKASKDFPENTVDVCIAFNWLYKPNFQHKEFGNWMYSQMVMKDAMAFKTRLLTFRDDIMLNTDQYKLYYSEFDIVLKEIDALKSIEEDCASPIVQGSSSKVDGLTTATKLSVDRLGNPWIVESSNKIFKYSTIDTDYGFPYGYRAFKVQLPIQGKDISVGEDGSVWYVDVNGEAQNHIDCLVEEFAIAFQYLKKFKTPEILKITGCADVFDRHNCWFTVDFSEFLKIVNKNKQ